MNLTFLGGTGTVTGSKYLLETQSKRVLIDCGLFQGLKQLRLRNWAAFPVEPSTLDAVILTHAHIDHSGYLPVLAKHGFQGPVYATSATRELCSILLPDSGHLQEEEAKRANRHGYSRHKPAFPLYTREEGERVIQQFEPWPFHETHALSPKVKFSFLPAGHILGAASVLVEAEGKTLLFSGDVGRLHDPVMYPPLPFSGADYLVVESTYGDRRHETSDPADDLAEVINRTLQREGTIVIPSFAVGRTQTILHLLVELKQKKRIPDVPIFLDSPMAVNATEMFFRHHKEHRLTEAQCQAMGEAATYVNDPEESKALDHRKEPMILISASGMATGGRVLFHLRRFAPRPHNTILFVGFQAAGTRGEALIKGANVVKIQGQYVPVRAEVSQIHNLSAHADYLELTEWLRTAADPPKQVFLTHGEPVASDAMRRHLEERLHWNCVVPEHRETVTL